MRRSFGGSNQGMGGGNGGIGDDGGGMLRSVARAINRTRVGGGLQEPISSSTSNSKKKTTTRKPNFTNLLSLSSSSLSSCSSPLSATSSLHKWPLYDDFEWVDVDGSESSDDTVHHREIFDDFVLGPVPSIEEIQNVVSALQQTQLSLDNYGAEDNITSPPSLAAGLDWIEPTMNVCNPKLLQPLGYNRVYDALHLLQNDKSVQRMVLSLSSDKAVWDAVLNNEAVRELKESFDSDEDYFLPCSDKDKSDTTKNILKWIFDGTKAKATELFQTIMNLVTHLFQAPETGKTEGAIDDPFEQKLRSSFLLTVLVLFIVVVSRFHNA